MAKFDIRVLVEYNYEVEADSMQEAEQHGWKYEDYKYSAEVNTIKVSEQEDEDEDE